MPKKRKSTKGNKRGRPAERLIVAEDPAAALQRLLKPTTPPKSGK